MSRKRNPAVAGQFYPSDPDGLLRTISWCYTHRVGPGSVPTASKRAMTGLTGFVVPHAGYQCSGPVAAHAFLRMAELGKPDVAVLLGPNHYGAGERLALSAWDEWETPLGSLAVETELGRDLAGRVALLVPNEQAHLGEHSIEVQLPFLLHSFGPGVPVLPISMADQSLDTARLLGRALARALAGRSVLLLASSDLSHFLPDSEARREDRRAIDAVLSLDPEVVADVVEARGVTMCGYGPVMVMLAALGETGGVGARLLAYATSAETCSDPRSVVGYAAIAVEACS